MKVKMTTHQTMMHNTIDDTFEVISCKSKNRYETYWQAKFVADEQMQYHRGLKLDVYECKFCGGWHLTSRD